MPAFALHDDILRRRQHVRHGVQRMVANIMGIPESNLTKWLRNRVKISEDYAKSLGSRGRGHLGKNIAMSVRRGRKTTSASAEQVVFGKFDDARKKGGRVSSFTWRRWMREAAAQEKP